VKGIIGAVLVVGFHAMFFPSEAHAYLDPGTGSLIIQVIAGAFLALIMTFKLWWYGLKRFISRLLCSAEKSPAGSAEKDAE
jgi:hypothetical protein